MRAIRAFIDRRLGRGEAAITVPILDRPSTTPTDGGLHYTLTSSAGAVEGVLPFP